MEKQLSKNIVFFISQPLDNRNYDRFGVQYWIDSGWKVEVWDLTPFLFPKVWDNFLQLGKKIKLTPFYHQIHCKEDIFQRASTAEPGIFIDLIEINQYVYLKIKLLLLSRGFLSLTLRMGAIPLPVPYNANRIERMWALLRNIVSKESNLLSTFKHLFLKVYFEHLLGPYQKQLFRVVSGNVTYLEALALIPNEQIVKAHNFDYDQYLSDNRINEFENQKFLLFIDEDMAYHSDFIYQNKPFPVNPEVYFSVMRNGLAHIAHELKCDIKIATHPRSNYTGLRSNCYGDLPLYNGITAELIKSAFLVVGHASTSMQLAVLHRKPILFVTTDEIINSSSQAYIDKYSSILNRPLLNLNGSMSDVNWESHLDIDDYIYDDYIRQYIKSENTSDKYSMEIVNTFLSNLVS
jgi:hypothetical protein